jgi:hypothetical protein
LQRGASGLQEALSEARSGDTDDLKGVTAAEFI